MTPLVTAAAESAPAGGAAFEEILIAAALISVTYIPIAWFLWRERAGKPTLVGRFADWCAEFSGLARWAALPLLLLVLSVIPAGFGVYWDVPLHSQVGRDEGPLANPSHYPILFALMGILASGLLGVGLARDPLPRRTIRLAKDWHAPMGAFVAVGAGVIAMLGFPLDDLWHRLFGQDVTEWGPTHVMMIGGATTSFISCALLLAESIQVGRPPKRFLRPLMLIAIGGNWTTTAFLMEFDLGIPQFPAATLFIISGVMCGWVMVASRLWWGPGGALLSWGLYILIRLLINALVIGLPDIRDTRWMLYLGAAVMVELTFLAFKNRGPWVAALAGLLAGSVGLLTEWPWMAFFMPFPLPPEASQMPLLLTTGAIAGAGGGLIGWSMARCVTNVSGERSEVDPSPSATGRFRYVGTLGTLAFIVLMAVYAPPQGTGSVEAQKKCDPDTGACMTEYKPLSEEDLILGTPTFTADCIGEDDCHAGLTLQLQPADAADDAVWISAIAYQGRKEEDPEFPMGLYNIEMRATGNPGEFESVGDIPLYGQWKSFVRLHLAPTTMVAFPLHLPEDPSIDTDNSGLIQAKAGVMEPFVMEPFMLQRERKQDVPTWLWGVMYAVVIACWLALLAFYGWLYAAAAAEEEEAPVEVRLSS